MPPARSTTSRSLPVNAKTRRLVTRTSPEAGATAGWMAEPGSPSANRPVPAMDAKLLLRSLTSGRDAGDCGVEGRASWLGRLGSRMTQAPHVRTREDGYELRSPQGGTIMTDIKGPVVFIHGLWLHASSWQPWQELFADAGYEPSAPGWPG